MSKAPENMTREELIAAYSKLQFELKELKRAMFGKKCERFIPLSHGEGQMELPFEIEEK